MSTRISSLAELLDPMTAEAFLADHLHKAPLHLRGRPEKFASVIDWSDINRMLAMDVWTQQTLQLHLDKNRVPAGAYCVTAANRDHQSIMRPDPDKVQELMGHGATLLLNEIETLAPGLGQPLLLAQGAQRLRFPLRPARCLRPADLWDQTLEHLRGPARSADRTRDVPECPADGIRSPQGQGRRDRRDEPGRPALSAARQVSRCADDRRHFGASRGVQQRGLDWLTQLWNIAVRDPEFRSVLPLPSGPSGEQALQRHLKRLYERLGTLAFDEQSLRMVTNLRANYGIKRGRYDLPDLPETGPGPK
jgi:hypothetical protein